MARKLSAATKLKIARSLKGNKNAFSGGPKKSPLSTRQKIANINAATKAKKANLSSDQIARRASVAKRLRAQARREEALGGGNPGTMKTNADEVSAALAQSDRLKAGGLQAMSQAKTADEIRAATAKIREARNALKQGAPRSTRKESQAKVQPKAKQNLNAPQGSPEALSTRTRPAELEKQASTRRAAFAEERRAQAATVEGRAARSAALADANQRAQQSLSTSAARKSDGPVEGHDAKSVQGKPLNVRPDYLQPASERRAALAQRNQDLPEVTPKVTADTVRKVGRVQARSSPDNVVVPGSRKNTRKTDPLKALHKEMAAEDRRTASLQKKVDAADLAVDRAAARRRSSGQLTRSMAELKAVERQREADNALFEHKAAISKRREQPRPPQSDTGTNRSGTFTKDVPVTGESNTRNKVLDANERAAQDFSKRMETMTQGEGTTWLKRFSQSIPRDELERMARESGTTLKELGL